VNEINLFILFISYTKEERSTLKTYLLNESLLS
jgi:hypothetical protein